MKHYYIRQNKFPITLNNLLWMILNNPEDINSFKTETKWCTEIAVHFAVTAHLPTNCWPLSKLQQVLK